ncbi:hypothetical protein L208DRAFT_1287270 [Tricholoma matsutake]|nr:hypothetical protein L208DRAFT_1287270 [Tricholoma matsutake 945]
MEEAVFSVQGIIMSKDLPPIYDKPRIPVHRFKYLRQNVVLTGLRSATFSSALDAAQAIYRYFDQQFPKGLLDSWSSVQSGSSGIDSMDLSNHFLTLLKDTRGLESIPFHKGFDLHSILCELAKGDHIHTEDNYVEYFSMRKDRLQRWTQTVIGDIVQAQLLFVVIPVKGGRRKMLTTLRSLALLDVVFTNNLVCIGNCMGYTRGFPTLLFPNLFNEFCMKNHEKKIF